MTLIIAWKEEAIAVRKLGFNDIEVCQRARCSLEQLKREFARDPEFKARYDDAAKNPTPLKW